MAAGPKNKNGEVEAQPAEKYENYDGPQRVGADLGTAYPITGEPPKETETTDAPDDAPQDVDVQVREQAEKDAKKSSSSSSAKKS